MTQYRSLDQNIHDMNQKNHDLETKTNKIEALFMYSYTKFTDAM